MMGKYVQYNIVATVRNHEPPFNPSVQHSGLVCVMIPIRPAEGNYDHDSTPTVPNNDNPNNSTKDCYCFRQLRDRGMHGRRELFLTFNSLPTLRSFYATNQPIKHTVNMTTPRPRIQLTAS